MTGKDVGYIRVSTTQQNTARQLDGVQLDKVFEEKISGKSIDRPELKACLVYLREGDCLHVHSMDRLARNLDDLRKIVRDLTKEGIKVRFHKENLIFTGDDSPMSQLLLSMMGAFAEFERSLIKERQLEGIQIAKTKGLYRGRRPALSQVRVAELLSRISTGASITALAREYGISRETVYQYKRTAEVAASNVTVG